MIKTIPPPSFREGHPEDCEPTAPKISRLLRKKWPDNGCKCKTSHTPYDKGFDVYFIPDRNGISQDAIFEIVKYYFPGGGKYRLLFRPYKR